MTGADNKCRLDHCGLCGQVFPKGSVLIHTKDVRAVFVGAECLDLTVYLQNVL